MRTREDVESYLMRSGQPYEEVQPDTWVVCDPATGENIVVRLAGPLVVFRTKMLTLEKVSRRADLFQKLLELNASEMVHGAYGLSDGAVVLTCSLRLENLDYNELSGTLDDFSLAMTNHYQTLAGYRDA